MDNNIEAPSNAQRPQTMPMPVDCGKKLFAREERLSPNTSHWLEGLRFSSVLGRCMMGRIWTRLTRYQHPCAVEEAGKFLMMPARFGGMGFGPNVQKSQTAIMGPF